MIVGEDKTYNNKKPRQEWKNRFIYAFLGLFVGAVGAHNFYAGYKVRAVGQLILALIWLPMLSGLWNRFSGLPQETLTPIALGLAFLEMIWVYLEVFLVAKDSDGDYMSDEAYPVRILLSAIVIVMYVILPLLLYSYLYFQKSSSEESAGETKRQKLEMNSSEEVPELPSIQEVLPAATPAAVPESLPAK